MWKNFFDLVRRVLLLNERTTQNHEQLAELREEVRVLSRTAEEGDLYLQRQIERLTYEIKRLEDELRQSREREADARMHEAEARERLRLEIENQLLRENRQLPPAIQKTTKDYTD